MKLAIASALVATGLLWMQPAGGQSPLNQLEQRLQPPAGGSAAVTSAKGYLGAELDDEGEQGKGVRVTKVRPGTPAEASGIKTGDLITTINGKAIANLDGYDAAAVGPPGTRLQMTVERNGRPQPLNVTLGIRPASPPATGEAIPGEPQLGAPTLSPPGGPAAPGGAPPGGLPGATPPGSGSFSSPSASGGAAAPPSLTPPAGTGTSPAPATPDGASRGSGIQARPLDLGPPPSEAADAAPPPVPGGFGSAAAGSGGASLGITVVPLTEQARAETGVPVRRGAVIAVIKPGSPADRAGLPLGGVIARIDGREVSSADDLVAAIRAARPGQEVELTYYEGNRIQRKLVRLAPAGGMAAPGSAGSVADAPGPGAAGPGGLLPPGIAPRLGAGGGNRPLMQGIERLAENLTRPTGTSTVYDPLVIAALQTRVVELSDYAKELEERIRVLEGKLGVSRGAGSAPAPGARPAAPGFGPPSSTPGAAPGFGPAASGTGTNP